ncbi:hypothetical protein [Actinokineospora iranica]|uniref:Uncharacterized protein n=1 Tax=Actinokineospora iranica TaxID=1271860 RepID=A0A1G6UET1_9PSEU|nr:hypothetical protein [Actinokineospora iranica]SDD39216.1 hypothetical protein SAMN05216174_110216 [Actinokineospora iranica]
MIAVLAAAQSENAGTIAIVVMAVVLPIAAAAVLFAYRHRFTSPQRQQQVFAARFDGHRIVHFQPWYWSFDTETARRIAWSRGYVERDLNPGAPRVGAHRDVVTFVPGAWRHPPRT